MNFVLNQAFGLSNILFGVASLARKIAQKLGTAHKHFIIRPMATLFRSTANTSSGTLVSRVLGFVRDIVLARSFGAGAATDAFFVAFKIPNLLRRLFAEGSFALAFVPVLAEYREQGDMQSARELIDSVFGSLLAILLVITAFGVLAAPLVIRLVAPGFEPGSDSYGLASGMLRITFPYLLFISLTALLAGVLNTWEKFWLPAVTPALLNISLICAALLLAPRLEVPITALAWGVLAAGILQLLLQLLALQRMGLFPRPRWGFAHRGVRKIMRLMVPTLFGSSVAQINILLDTLLATLLLTGSVSWLYYSDRLFEFPLGVFGVTLSTVVLPRLARIFNRREPGQANSNEFTATINWAMRLALLIGLPAAVGLGVLAQPVIAGMFQYGEFTAFDTRMASWSLMAYCSGLPAFIAIKVLAPGFYARQDTVTPVKIGIIAMLTNMLGNVLLLLLLMHLLTPVSSAGFWERLASTPGLHAALALASAGAAYLNAGLLWRKLRQSGWWELPVGWAVFVVKVVLSALTMGILLYLTVEYIAIFDNWLSGFWWQRAMVLLTLVGGGVMVNGLMLLLFGIRLKAILAGSN